MPYVPPTGEDPLDELERLAVLRDDGVLSQAEFEARKALVLSLSWAAGDAAPRDRPPAAA